MRRQLGPEDCLDMIPILVDGTNRCRADPAFDAYFLPIGQWAQAIWHQWLPTSLLGLAIDQAKVKFAKARNTWNAVSGPAAALIVTASRLGCCVLNATEIMTDDGRLLQLHLDSPKAVLYETYVVVRRWRWRNVET